MAKARYDVRGLALTIMLAFLLAFMWYYMPESLGLIKEIFLFLFLIAGINIMRVARKVLVG